MKLWLQALGMCQANFFLSPRRWGREGAEDRMLLFLPLVGVEIGLIWWGAECLCQFLEIPQPIFAFVRCVLPMFLTGYVHMAGFFAVTEALHTRREGEKTFPSGSFGAIGTALLLLAQYSAVVSLYPGRETRIFLLIPIVSRCCAAIALLTLPRREGHTAGKYIIFPLLMLVAALVCGFGIRTKFGLTLLAAVLGYGLALLRAFRLGRGMGRDVAGYGLVLSELSALLMLAILY